MLCVFSIFRHEGSYARRICKGTFHSPGKKSPVLASLVRYFLPFALDKYSVLRWQVFRKKEKNVVLWWGVRFVILLPGFVRMVGEPPRSAGYAISFCNNRQSVLWCNALISLSLCFYMCKGQKPPAKTPPEAVLFIQKGFPIYHFPCTFQDRM